MNAQPVITPGQIKSPQLDPKKQETVPQPPIKYKSLKYLTFLILTYCLGSFYFGYMLAYISSISFTTIREVFHIDWNKSLAQGLIIGAIPFGALIGSTASRFLVTRFARRKIIIYTNFFALTMGGILYIQDPFVLFFARMGQGFCLGVYSALTPVIVHQFAPVQIAGRLGAYHQLLVFTGSVTAFLLKYICELIADDLPGKKIWYYVFGLPLITVSIQTFLLLFKFKFNTPKYLVEKHKHIAAHKVLKKIYKQQYVQQKYLQLLIDLGIKAEDIPIQQRIYHPKGIQILLMAKPEQKTIKNNKKDGKIQKLVQQNQLAPMQSNTRLNNQNPQRQEQEDNNDLDGQNQNNQIDPQEDYQTLQTPRTAKFLALFIALLQRFSGINAVVAYSGQVVGKVTPDLVSIFPIIINMLPVITNFIISFYLRKIGRKPLLQFGAAVACLSTAIVAIGFFISYDHNSTAGTVLIFTGQMLYMANFGFSLGPVVWLYLSQIAMEEFVPYAVAVNWIGCSIVMVLFPIIKASLPYENPAPLFIFFSVWSLLEFIINGKFAIETKGKHYKQIYDQFTGVRTEAQIKQIQNKQIQKRQDKKNALKIKNNQLPQNNEVLQKPN